MGENSYLDEDDVKILADELRVNRSVRHIHLAKNDLGDDGAQAIAEALKDNTSLPILDLDLSENEIGWEGTEALAAVLESTTTLTDLYDAGAIAEALKTNSTLTRLDLAINNIDRDSAFVFAEALGVNTTTLKVLKLNCNEIDDDGAVAVFEARVHRRRPQDQPFSDLSHDRGGQEGTSAPPGSRTLRGGPGGEHHGGSAEAWQDRRRRGPGLFLATRVFKANRAVNLASALELNTTVTSLTLDKNEIGDAGAEAFAGGLKGFTALKSLSLCENMIGAAGALAIAVGLAGNASLRCLDLSETLIDAAAARHIAEGLRTNTRLRILSLEKNPIGDQGAWALSGALKVNITLTDLNLEKNEIGDAGAHHLAEALEANTSLKELSLYDNRLGDEGGAGHLCQPLLQPGADAAGARGRPRRDRSHHRAEQDTQGGEEGPPGLLCKRRRPVRAALPGPRRPS